MDCSKRNEILLSTHRQTRATNLPQSSTPSRLSAKNFVSGSDQAKSSVWDIIFNTFKNPRHRLNTVQNLRYKLYHSSRPIHHLWNTGKLEPRSFAAHKHNTWGILGSVVTGTRKKGFSFFCSLFFHLVCWCKLVCCSF